MMDRDRFVSPSTLYVELRQAEIQAEALEQRRARQAMAGRHLRHRVGHALITLGETLSETRLDPLCADCIHPATSKS